uniref:PTS glucose/sucrose transporter subunit IIB n=1 Tax=Salmonella enterica TaxID=28901 RepID=UPI000A5379EA
MDKTAALASDILRGIGGEQNILRLENCMTRVRVEVQDDSQLDIPRLKALPGVSGYVKQGEQHQLIVGPGKAAQVVDAMRVQIAAGGVKPDDAMARTKSEAKAKYKAPMSDALRKLANVFIRERSEFCVTLKILQRHHIIQPPFKINRQLRQ